MDRLQALLRRCFELEMAALKPGNVSRYAQGHGMRADDFLLSARLVSPILCNAALSVGERVFRAAQITRRRVGCNTNLGMLLLCTPLLAAASSSPRNLRVQLATVLGELNADDGRFIFQAIRLAAPGGLGSSERYDVHRDAGGELLAAMHYARRRDRIALQYVSVFDDVFSLGVPWITDFLNRGESVEWALALCYISFLGSFLDSHVARKHGEPVAQWLRKEAATGQYRPARWDKTSGRVPGLLCFDAQLKQNGINPGTSADLAVASLLACMLDNMLA